MDKDNHRGLIRTLFRGTLVALGALALIAVALLAIGIGIPIQRSNLFVSAAPGKANRDGQHRCGVGHPEAPRVGHGEVNCAGGGHRAGKRSGVDKLSAGGCEGGLDGGEGDPSCRRRGQGGVNLDELSEDDVWVDG